MEFGILGPLEARVDGEPIGLGGLRQQKALTVLLLDAGRVVSRDRQTEALEVYRDARTMLTEELGIEPGPELRGLQQAILAGNRSLDLPERVPGPQPAGARAHSRPVRPAQLPADLAEFTGRADALERLGKLLPAVGDADSVPTVAVITGAAGIGKTAVAIHFAHQVAGRFPDGQLYVNLNGYAPTPPISPLRALTQLLHSLGVDADKIPVDVDAAAGLYRSLLAGRRLLVVLDNAREAEQVRPLLPGGSGCMVLVTSRDRLTGLVATHSVRRVPMSVLTGDEAVTLLARILGQDRVGAQPDAVLALAEACGHLPLALRIAAANLTCYPDEPIADYVVALREGDRLAELSVEGDPQAAVLTTFDRLYESLAADARRLFRLLGLVPGPDFTAQAAAALAAIPPDDAERLLDRLADAHLLEPRPDGRYAFHDLLRLYARQRAEREDAEPARRAAVERLLGWYVGAVDAAATLAYPHLLRLPAPAPAGLPAVRFDDHAEALAWLDAERASLVTAIVHAARHGPRPSAWILADALRGYFWLRRLAVDALAVGDAGLAAAVAGGDLRAQAASRFMLGDAHQAIGNYALTIEHYTTALALAREDGWVEGEAATLGNLGNAYGDMGSLREAAEHYAQALEAAKAAVVLANEVDDPRTEAEARNSLGSVHLLLGDAARALDAYGRALRLARDAGTRFPETGALLGLAAVLLARGDREAAADAAWEALAVHRRTGHRLGEARTLVVPGDALRQAGVLGDDGAMALWWDAAALFAAIGNPEAARLNELTASVEPGG